MSSLKWCGSQCHSFILCSRLSLYSWYKPFLSQPDLTCSIFKTNDKWISKFLYFSNSEFASADYNRPMEFYFSTFQFPQLIRGFWIASNTISKVWRLSKWTFWDFSTNFKCLCAAVLISFVPLSGNNVLIYSVTIFAVCCKITGCAVIKIWRNCM